jgi:hypothetical protein
VGHDLVASLAQEVALGLEDDGFPTRGASAIVVVDEEDAHGWRAIR